MTGIAISIIVVRFLGEYNYGVYSILRIILTFLSVFLAFGLRQAILRYLPEFKAKEQYNNIKTLIIRTLLIQSFLWFVVLFVFFLVGDILDLWFRTDLKAYLLVAISMSLLGTIFTTLQQVLTSLYEIKFITLNLLIRSFLLFGLTFVFLKIGLGIYGVFIAAGVCNLFIVFSFGWKLPKLLPFNFVPSITAALNSFDQKRILRYSFPIIGTGILNLIVWRQSEALFLGYFFSPLEAGYYNLAYQLPQQILEFIPLAIWPLILASFSEIYSKKRDNLGLALTTYYKLLFCITVPISIIGILLGDKAIIILYGEHMAKAGPLCQIFFLLFCIFSIETPLSMAFYILEKTWINLIILFSQAIINIGLDLLIIPRYGLYGAVVPVAIVLMISPYFRYLIVKKFVLNLEIPWRFIGKTYFASSPLLLLWILRPYATTAISFSMIIIIAIFILTLSVRYSNLIEQNELAILRDSSIPMKDLLLKILTKQFPTIKFAQE